MKNQVFRWIWKNGRKSVPFIIFLTVLSIVLSLVSLQFAMVSRSVINIAMRTSQGSLLRECFRLAGLLLGMLVLQIAINYANVHANSRFEIDLKRSVFRTLINRDYLSVAKYHSGELLNRINSDVSVIVNGIITIIPALALFLTSIIGAFCYLFSIDRTLAVVILCAGPFGRCRRGGCTAGVIRRFTRNARPLRAKPIPSCWKSYRICLW